jgi:energy-coupling factor transport system permease protein
MIQLPGPSDRARGSTLGRASPLTKLGVAAAWLVGLVLTLDPRVPIVLAVAALAGTILLGRVPAREFIRGAVPLWAAALVIGSFNAVFSGANSDPIALEVTRVGPFRLTEPALVAGAAIALRVIAIAATSVAFARTTEPTTLADSLVQQARVPERFAYGALAAYQALPRLGNDLLTLRQARRIRGLRASWHPRVLIGLLALAVRHADRLAVAMDARAFGVRPRTRFREMRWGFADGAVALGGLVALAVALLATRF